MRPRRAPLWFLLGLLLLCACGPRRHANEPSRSLFEPAEAGRESPFELLEEGDRPRLGVLRRDGDPKAAVAFAVAHHLGSAGSVAIAAVVGARLGRAGYVAAHAKAHAFGFQIETLARDPKHAAEFFSHVQSALTTPIASRDESLPLVQEQLDALRTLGAKDAASRKLSECSGELKADVPKALGKVQSAQGLALLERYREQIVAAAASSFGVAGQSAIVAEAIDAWHDITGWPRQKPQVWSWPAKDHVIAEHVAGERRVSLAAWLKEPGLALEAARRLSEPGSRLSQRLETLFPPWRLSRAQATTNPAGGCLKLDVVGPESIAQHGEIAARVALTLKAEMRSQIARSEGGSFELQRAAREASDPRDAAGLVAWGALLGANDAQAERWAITYRAKESESSVAAFTKAYPHLKPTWLASRLETAARFESGQGELWILAASPCGTSIEGLRDAGLTELALRSAARSASVAFGAQIEPWLSPDGAGLLIHGPRLERSQSPEEHAEKLADALGRALTGVSLEGASVGHARAELLEELGNRPLPGLWNALLALSPEHPSWLEARGDHSTVPWLSLADARQRLRTLAREPLRVAVLANESEEQAGYVARALSTWLKPLGPEAACPDGAPLPPQAGQLTVSAGGADEADAYVAALLPGASLAAEVTAHLIQRPGGWLEDVLLEPNLARGGRLRVVRGRAGTALVLELFAEAEQLEGAIDQARALLDRISRGATSAADLKLGLAQLAAERAARALRPRERLIELWQAPAKGPLALAELHRAQRLLAAEKQLVLRVQRLP